MPFFRKWRLKMEKEILREPMFCEEIIGIIRSDLSNEEISERLHDYHENDIAQSIEKLTKEERSKLYDILGAEWFSEVLAFIDEPEDLGAVKETLFCLLRKRLYL